MQIKVKSRIPSGLNEELGRKIFSIIKGKEGKQGDKGEQGIQGEQGIEGKKGKDGVDGEDGLNGLNGKDGLSGKKGKDGVDGKDADEEKILKKVLKQIPAPVITEIIQQVREEITYEQIKNAPTPQQIRNIASRDYDLTELKDVTIQNPINGQTLVYNIVTKKWENGAGGSSSNQTYNEVPAGVINAINTTFTLLQVPQTNTLKLYLNGIRQMYTTDFTLTGNTITMGSPPLLLDTLLADYNY